MEVLVDTYVRSKSSVEINSVLEEYLSEFVYMA